MKIGIANDMILACEALRRVVQSVPDHQVIWTARDGVEAVDMARKDRPDLILMDLLMPRVDGVEATRRIMADYPCAILVVTATVSGNVGKVYEAMGHGALDAVDTPALGPAGQVSGAADLLSKIDIVGKLIGKPAKPEVRGPREAEPPAIRQKLGALVLIGASTGGPNALANIISALPVDWPACVIVVQHIDIAFAPGLAAWLGERSRRRVELLAPGQRPMPGQVLVAGTNDHLAMTAGRLLTYTPEPRELCFRPSVDVFFSSVAAHWPDPGVAVLLTGMGRDGGSGLLTLRRGGWHTIAQDELTSVVWGMPKAAVELGAAVQVLPIDQVAGAIVEQVRKRTHLEGRIA